MGYQDTQCGAKIFKTKIVQSLIPKLKVMNNAFDVELLLMLKKGGCTVREEKTLWIENAGSAMFGSPINIVTSSWDMFKTVRHLAKNN